MINLSNKWDDGPEVIETRVQVRWKRTVKDRLRRIWEGITGNW